MRIARQGTQNTTQGGCLGGFLILTRTEDSQGRAVSLLACPARRAHSCVCFHTQHAIRQNAFSYSHLTVVVNWGSATVLPSPERGWYIWFMMLMIPRLFKGLHERAGAGHEKTDHKVPSVALEMTYTLTSWRCMFFSFLLLLTLSPKAREQPSAFSQYLLN